MLVHPMWTFNPVGVASAEVNGNRTRLVEMLGHVGFEDRGGHQAPTHLRREIYAH